MKTHLLLLTLCLACLRGNAEKSDGNIDFIAPGLYQLTYPGQLIRINFEPDNYARHQGLFVPADLSENQRYEIVKVLKHQVDLLPMDFINTYLRINIVPGHIYDDHLFGFSHHGQLLIDVEKTKAEMSNSVSISYALFHEIGNLVFQQNSKSEATKSLKAYLNTFYLDHHNELQSVNQTFQSGFVSNESAGISQTGYTVSNEMAELFAYLTCIELRQKVIEFIQANPESILKEKIVQFAKYMETISTAFDHEDLNNGPIRSEQLVTETIYNFDSDQMLSLHEIKSNETFDFSVASEPPLLEASTYTVPTDLYEYEEEFQEEFYRVPDIEEEQIETIFNNSNDRKSKKKAKKAKNRKNGSGLLLVGSLIYLTLQLLSQ